MFSGEIKAGDYGSSAGGHSDGRRRAPTRKRAGKKGCAGRRVGHARSTRGSAVGPSPTRTGQVDRAVAHVACMHALHCSLQPGFASDEPSRLEMLFFFPQPGDPVTREWQSIPAGCWHQRGWERGTSPCSGPALACVPCCGASLWCWQAGLDRL